MLHKSANEGERVKIGFIIAAAIGLATLVLAQTGLAAPRERGGGQIVFFSEHGGEDEIWVMNADGTNKHNLTRHDGVKISDLDPRWSPDGRQIAFSSDPGGDREIWLMNADGASPRRLTNTPGARLPSWTADGKQIVFQAESGGNAEIYRVGADGSGLTDLTNDPGVDWSPATSPHSNSIVFTSERDGNGHLYVLDADGGLRRITNGPGYDYFANWSPRGNDIVFTRSDLSGETDLYVVHADGSGEHQLTNTPGVFEYFPAFSRDGRQVAYSSCTLHPLLLPSLHCSTHVINVDGTGDTDLAFAPLSLPFPITDNFDNSTRNVDLWSIIHDDVGGFVQWTNGRLEMRIAADGIQGNGQSNLGVHVGVNCLLSGDFDVQVDYQLLEWPPGDSVNVGIVAFFTNGSIERSGLQFGEFYNSFVDPSFGSVATQDTSGSLRLVRSGGTTTSYYKSGGTWVPLASAPAQPTTAIVGLSFKSYSDFGQQEAKVAFDNFRLDATNVDCSSTRPDLHPDWQPIAPTRG
jgi:Tol biopolymer transport system component